MKIIFLDIDGVLNSLTGTVSQNSLNIITTVSGANTLSIESIGLLKFVVDVTGAKIVISSTWRSKGGPDWFKGLFESYGWHKPPILDCTESTKGSEIRGDQINAWLNTKSEEYTSYVCIDDGSDFYDNQKLVQTSMISGFNLANAISCIDILGIKNVSYVKEISYLKEQLEYIT